MLFDRFLDESNLRALPILSMPLPNFVASFTSEQLAHLTELATTYALSHSLVYLPVNPPNTPRSAIHAPISLTPTPFPRHLFQKAQHIQKLYNLLYARIASDDTFLDEFLGENGVGSVDEFTREQWKGWKAAKRDGANVGDPRLSSLTFLTI
jgi:glutathione synthase